MGGASPTAAIKAWNFYVYYINKNSPSYMLPNKKGEGFSIGANSCGANTILHGIIIWDQLVLAGYNPVSIRISSRKTIGEVYHKFLNTAFCERGQKDKLRNLEEYNWRWKMLKDYEEFWEDTIYV